MTDTGHNLVPVDFDPFAPPSHPDTLPLTEPQAEMWTAAAMDEDANRSYNQCFVFALHGVLHVESLRAALAQVLSRHHALRAVISADGSGQTILAPFPVEIPVLDLSGLDQGARAREIDALVERECETPFDLEHGPLIRALVARESERQSRFVLTVHHIVCDGWSSSVLFNDLARAYAADRSGIDAQLPQAPSYVAYVTEQAGESAAAARRADEDYWAAQFADGAPVLDLPLSRPRPEVKTFRGAQETHLIDPQLYAALRGAGAKAGATLFATLLAAFELLVHRLSRQNDFVVGIPLAGQAFLEDSRLVAHCVHTLPLRARVDPTQPFLAHLRAVRMVLADAQEHPHLTFGSLVRRLRIPRDASRTPLVAVTFNIDKIGAPFDFKDIAIASLTVPKAYTNFEIAVNVVDSGKDALVECAYNSDLFSGAAIKSWLAHYETLLRSIVANPDAVNSSLSLLTSDERTDILARFNPRATSAPGRSLHERFEAVARERPTGVAATCDGESLTYAELNRRANGLAARLRAMGVERNHLVALRTERSLSVAVGILGILKAGGAYLPMDPAYPRDRITFMLEDAGVRVAVTERALADDFAGTAVTVALIDEIEAADDIAASGSAPDDLAYVIYTSGSTGKPKGVRVTHHNVARLLEATNDWFHFDADDVWTLFHSYAFDFSVWELWGALLYGGRIVIVPQWVSRAPESFLELLVAEGVTVLNQTPSAFRQLIQADLGTETVSPLKLRYVIFGGEALELQSLRPWFERHGDDRPLLVNMYGITETTVHVTYRPIRLADLESGAGSVIGEPIPDLRVYLLDGNGEPVPQGVPGEICRRRRRRRGGVPEQAGTHGAAIRPRYVRRLGPPVPFGRPCPAPRERRSRIPRPHRPTGEDPRIPHRAGRNRGGPRPATGHPRSGGHGP